MDYKVKIIEIVNSISNEKFLKMIFGFVRGLAEEENELQSWNFENVRKSGWC